MAASRALAGRYAFVRRIRGTQRTIIWLARDDSTRSTVVASVLSGQRAVGLERAIGITHPHAAAILSVVDRPNADEIPGDEPPASDARVVVAEHIEGRSLQQRLDAGPVAIENAVEWTASVADALVTLHGRGAVHGAISPRAILVIRPEPAVIPSLTHLLVPPSGAYCSPERVTGAGPSEDDDVWALAATLFTALARRAPFHGGSRTELARAIVAAAPRPIDGMDDDLWAIVAQALAREPRNRFPTAAHFRDALRNWTELTGRHSMGDFAPVEAMVAATEEPPNVGDLSLVAALIRPDSAEAMAPLVVHSSLERASLDPEAHSDPHELAPQGAAPPVPVKADAPPSANAATPVVAVHDAEKPRKSRASVVAGVAAALAVAAGIGVVANRMQFPEAMPAAKMAKSDLLEPSAAEPSGVRAAAAEPTATVEEAPGAAPEIPASASAVASAETAPAVPLNVNACAAAVLPETALGSTPDVGTLCTDRDLWGLTRKVDLQVLKNGRGPGLVQWVHLGRFDLAAVAMLRARCCPDAAPVAAATPKGVCETLTDSIHAVAADASAENIDHYASAVGCYVSHGVRYPAEWWDRIKADEARTYFEEFVKGLRPAR